jgi:hypothetical protein
MHYRYGDPRNLLGCGNWCFGEGEREWLIAFFLSFSFSFSFSFAFAFAFGSGLGSTYVLPVHMALENEKHDS